MSVSQFSKSLNTFGVCCSISSGLLGFLLLFSLMWLVSRETSFEKGLLKWWVVQGATEHTNTFKKTFSPFSDSVSHFSLSLHHLLLLDDFFFRLNSPVFSLHLSPSLCITLLFLPVPPLFLPPSPSLSVSLTTQYLILRDRSHF